VGLPPHGPWAGELRRFWLDCLADAYGQLHGQPVQWMYLSLDATRKCYSEAVLVGPGG
jgi:hypothetical protein